MIVRHQPTTAHAYDYFYVETWRPMRGWMRIKGRTVIEAACAAIDAMNARRWAVGLTPAVLGPQRDAWADSEAARFDVIASNTADTSEF